MAHSLGEQVLRYWLETSEERNGLLARWRVGTSLKWEDHGQMIHDEISQEMLDYVMVYVDHVMSLGGVPVLEMHVSLKGLVRDRMWGTSDAIVDVEPLTLHVIDYKHGFTPVHVLDDDGPNPQLMYYAAGALDAFGWRHKRVVLTIVQPRCMEVEPIQTHELSADDVKTWAVNDLWEAAHATDDPRASLVPGDWCKFCPALSTCPAIHAQAQVLAATEFLEVMPAKPSLVVPEDPVSLAKVLRWAPVIDKWLRACEEEGQAALERGERVPGFKLVKKRANRQWPTEDPKELLNALNLCLPRGRKLTNTGKLLAEPKLLSPAQLEKVFGEEIVNQVAEKPETGLTMAADGDKRPAVAVGPVTDFEELL